MTKKEIPTILIIGIVVTVLGWLFFPASPSTFPHKELSLFNIKQLNTGLVIYLADYDDRYLATSAMPGTRAVLLPYIKNGQLFNSYSTNCGRTRFNFNLAGVSANLPPYPGTAEAGIAEVGVWHTQIFGEKPGASIGFADTSAKFFAPKDFGKVATALSFQFDRKGVKLFPPDYLADQDPLRDNK